MNSDELTALEVLWGNPIGSAEVDHPIFDSGAIEITLSPISTFEDTLPKYLNA